VEFATLVRCLQRFTFVDMGAPEVESPFFMSEILRVELRGKLGEGDVAAAHARTWSNHRVECGRVAFVFELHRTGTRRDSHRRHQRHHSESHARENHELFHNRFLPD
jgi:hypothetical protein